ncbi:unnamed protein product [Aphanomyces euteiches]|uniref:peptidylprolyl isomerase n=1 Tax=Aphanomyces euteiches TaxID=100861 RepID=A0A6G0X5N6_9STRA|nr:hypothetical protein Ae201684_008382 [Aphanomyces euteiches]KAH9069905.1 hypothetical protein Ae201684P_002280 [Aphanomyces euteiches]KAH9118133.1 hypothetical protein AeMF1_008558 [Aphanomyces euteiches]KAH9157081.1 hypothetical protein AeRB84_001055 [Aphanomyces euteiches]KAH9158535.1 hypothetical protein LEN26_002908 [Aphanomyces euteiches]
MAKKKNKQGNQGNKESPSKKATTTKLTIEPGFFGELVHAGHSLVCEDPTEDMGLQLTGASLAHDASEGATTLYVTTERRELKVALCSLDKAKTAQWNLNHTFSPMDGAVTFTTEGPNTVHLSGFVEAEMDEDVDEDDMGMYGGDDDDDDDDDDEGNALLEVVEEEDEDDDEDEDEVEDSGRFEILEERSHEEKKSPKKESKKDDGKKSDSKKDDDKKSDSKKDDSKKRPLDNADSSESPKKAKNVQMRKGGVAVEEVTLGKGKEAVDGKKVQILYKGKLAKNGKQFDANQNRKSPFGFVLGSGNVIKGMDVGVRGMRVGGKRIITIPSKMGYGAEGAGRDIPPNSDLIFEIELLNA